MLGGPAALLHAAVDLHAGMGYRYRTAFLLTPGGVVLTGLVPPPPAGRAGGEPVLRQIKCRLPYLLDLLTLLMEAGATFLNALNQAVDEFRGHPVAD